MKNIQTFAIVLFVSLFATMSYGQIKVVAPNGDVGVGTATPIEKLDVDGNINVRGNSINVGTDSSGEAVVGVGDSRTSDGGAAFQFYTTAGATGGDYVLRMAANAGGNSGFTHNGAGTLRFTTVGAERIQLRTNSVTRLTVQASGQVDIAGSATVNGGMAVTSDRRLKNNVKTFRKGLDELMQLNPVKFHYNGKANTDSSREFVGLIAQELQQVLPEFVSDHNITETDDEGKTIMDETYLKIHDSELKYLMVNAIQDQQKIIEDQAKVIAEMQEELISIREGIESPNQSTVKLENGDQASVSQNYPNPFEESTQIDFSIPDSASTASIVFFTVDGKVLKNVPLNEKKGTINIDPSDLSNGIYSYQLVVDGKVIATNKMMKM